MTLSRPIAAIVAKKNVAANVPRLSFAVMDASVLNRWALHHATRGFNWMIYKLINKLRTNRRRADIDPSNPAPPPARNGAADTASAQTHS